MAEFATIARPYAKALFSLAQEQNQIESWLDELKILAEIVLQPKVQILIDEPECEYTEKAKEILSLLDSQPADELRNFIYLLAQNKRLSVLPEIYTSFQDYTLSLNDIKQAIIYTAFPIDNVQFAQVIKDLEKHFNNRLQAHQVVAPELIGGVKVEIGDQVLDLSLQGRLNSLHTALMN